MNKIPMLERFAAQSLMPYNGELIFSKEKFAELIVGECVKVVDSMADENSSDRYFWAIRNASENIKEHFEDEE